MHASACACDHLGRGLATARQADEAVLCAHQTADGIARAMASCAEAMAKSADAFTRAGLAPYLPPKYIKREVVSRSSLGPVGRFAFPLPTRANASTLRLYGLGLSTFADWQVGPIFVTRVRDSA